MPRPLGMLLGSDPVKHGALQLDRYANPSVPIPATVQTPHSDVYQWGALENDQIGDCVPASMYHADESLYLRRGLEPYPYQTAECVELYSRLTGYDPSQTQSDGSNPTDQGTDPAQAMAWWQKNGLPGHRIAGFAMLPAGSPNVRRAIWEFGAVIYAVQLPAGAQPLGVHWRGNDLGAAGSWGGHAVAGDSYTPGLLGFVSWGEQGDMDNAFAGAYLEQVLVPLSHDALSRGGIGPGGFNFSQMSIDLEALK